MATFADGIASRTMWAGLHERLLPQDKWFGIFAERGRLAASPAESVSTTTGSLPAATAPAPAVPAAKP